MFDLATALCDIFTSRCTSLVHSVVLRLHDVRPSVCLSVCLSVRLSVTLDNISWKSWKLIARTISLLHYPLLSQERVKLRTSNFVRTFLVLIGTKARYKFLEK